ncbi:MAG: autotransporter domain-containing protein [Rhizobiales bacterium]|nr:autotransporter domain-containing protein [Hyphomicrobiales bacterium]
MTEVDGQFYWQFRVYRGCIMQQQFQQSWAARRRSFLSGTAFAAIMLAGVAGQADGALAACTFSDIYTFSCGSMVSTPADFVPITANGVTIGTVEAGATISGEGLSVATAGGSFIIVNNGTVTGTAAGFNLQGLQPQGGDITYLGNGSAGATAGAGLSIRTTTGAIAVGTANTPVVPTFSGVYGLLAQSDAGPISVFLNGGSVTGGSGLAMESGGNISATLTGGTTISAGLAGFGFGIGVGAPIGSQGGQSVTSDANIGSAASRFQYGIAAYGAGSGNVALSQTGGAIYAVDGGLAVLDSGGTGTASVDTSADSSISVNGTAGTSVGIQATATGDVTVRAAGAISGGAGGILAISKTGEASVTASGTISGGAYGIVAASLAGTVTVTAAGTISDTQNGVLTQSLDRTDVAVSGTITASDIGLSAVGTHVSVSVGNGATVQGTNRGGVSVQASDSLIENNGTITGFAGVGSAIGSTTVNNAGSITGTSGIAVYLVGGANNSFVMSGPNATLSGVAIGSGTDTFGFAGTGSNSFDVGQIGTGWVLLDKAGSSDWSLTGMSTYTGPVTVSDGTLSVDGNLNSMSGATVTGGQLVVNSDLTWASGVTVNGGRLSVNGTLHGPVSVASGGTLGGGGTIDGSATVDGTLSAGNSPGTLTIKNDLTLNGGSTSVFELNTPGVVGGTGAGGNDLVKVGNNLTLGGTLDARVAAAGFYRLFTYGGTLSGSFASSTVTGTGGFAPAAGAPDVQTGIANQVNLSVLGAGQTMQFWDGTDMAGNGMVDGGAGTWSSAGTNWTGAPGHAEINGTWGGSVGVFAGAAGGVVTVNGTQGFDTLQFSSSGYAPNGGSLALSPSTGAAATLNVDSGITTTVASTIVDGIGNSLRKAGSGTLVLTGTNTYTGGTQLVGGTLSVSTDANLGAASGALTFDGGTLQNTAALSTARNVTLLTGGGTLQTDAGLTLAGTISGDGTLTKTGVGTLTLSGINSYGNTFVVSGVLIGNANSIAGGLVNNATVVFDQGGDGAFAGAIGGSGTMVKQGTGKLTLTGSSALNWSIVAGGLSTAAERFLGNADIGSGASLTFEQSANATYGGVLTGTGRITKTGVGALVYDGDGSSFVGTTEIAAGKLIVGSDATHANAVLGGAFDVAAGAVLGGYGTVGNTIVSGGTLSPGNSIGTLTVAGNLVMTAASTYMVEVSGASADKTVVTGTATLGGKVVVDPLARLPMTTTYTIMTAGTRSGTFSGVDFLTATNFARNPRLAYVGNDVLLTLDPGLLSPILPSYANVNQRNVAAGIDDALLGGATLPNGFNALFALSGDPLLKALSLASGEIAATAPQAAFDAQSQFLNSLTDPFAGGYRGNASTAGSSSLLGYAATAGEGHPRDVFAALVTKAPQTQTFEQRWRTFGAVYGGNTQIGGNAALGSHDATSRVYGAMGGVSYALSPTTELGFAFGGGGTSFALAGGMGSGHSDMFQAGVFAHHGFARNGYLSGAFAYGWHDVTTDRTVSTGERLRGDYKAGVLSGRLEAGWRIDTAWAGVTPYAAAQAISYRMPSYLEQGNGAADSFALAYAGRDVTATRSELGLRLDRTMVMGETLFTLRGRAAWAHNFDTARNAAATFQALPGSSFLVSGAAMAPDAALVSAGAEIAWRNGFALAVSFEGEFSNNVTGYTGKGTLRYAW